MKDKTFYLPRLQPEFYRGDAVVLWTLPVEQRQIGWLSPAFHQTFREILFHVAARERLVCPVYCLMPDHIHCVWMGLNPDCDQLHGMAFLRRYLKPTPAKFQVQAHDHVLRDEERKQNAFAAICAYVRDNAVRARLVKTAVEWPYIGFVIPGYPAELDLLTADYWPKFWKIYYRLRDAACGERKLPLRDTRPKTS